jgi:arylsulfatase A-like enzyme
MKAIMVMFDSLNRHMLPPYGCDWVHAPNFQRLAERTVKFVKSYVGSMPCMPARREIHTGRYNFLHRSWGPIEPFDDSMPEILKSKGVHTHLISDHYHYWEEGGCNYHTRYKTWEIVRGQEGDPWKCNLTRQVPGPEESRNYVQRQKHWIRQDFVNRSYMEDEPDHHQTQTFRLGLEFLDANHKADNWFLHLETFDPHEPYFSYERYQKLYPEAYKGPHYDWPRYGRVEEAPEVVQHLRNMNAALVSMCDHYLGKILGRMDELGLWKDTLLIVNTDHGFLLGEHGWWAKCCQPFYNEIAHTPLFIWDPRCGKRGEERRSLVQTIDLAPTLLEFFGIERPKDMQGKPLRETIAADAPVREAGLFGLFGGHVNVTDGRHVYMRAPVRPDNTPLYEYTHMPTHMRRTFPVEELQDIQLQPPFPFTKGCRTMKIKGRGWVNAHQFGTMLFDLEKDPAQNTPIHDPAAEERMVRLMVKLMRENDAPEEQFERLAGC